MEKRSIPKLVLVGGLSLLALTGCSQGPNIPKLIEQAAAVTTGTASSSTPSGGPSTDTASAAPTTSSSGSATASAADCDPTTSPTASASASASAKASATPSASSSGASSPLAAASTSPSRTTSSPASSAAATSPAASTVGTSTGDWFDYPFSASSPANRLISSGATYESASGSRSAGLIGASGATVNSASWSFAFYQAKSSDPVVNVRSASTGAVIATINLPSGASTTGGSDDHMGVVQPDGYTAYEFYKMQPSGSGWTAKVAIKTDLRGDGMSAGARAAGTSIFWGVIRQKELAAGSIKHSLLLGVPSSALKVGQVWPARSQDSFAASEYRGSIPMGSFFAIPKSVDVNSLGLSGKGLALAKALQQYGAYVFIQSGSTALYAEKDANQSDVASLRTAFVKLKPMLRAVTNNTP